VCYAAPRRLDAFGALDALDGRLAALAGCFLPCERLCFRASIKFTTLSGLAGGSGASIVLPAAGKRGCWEEFDGAGDKRKMKVASPECARGHSSLPSRVKAKQAGRELGS
jgi:hypothetical protein